MAGGFALLHFFCIMPYSGSRKRQFLRGVPQFAGFCIAAANGGLCPLVVAVGGRRLLTDDDSNDV
jgi:hypothetical protein